MIPLIPLAIGIGVLYFVFRARQPFHPTCTALLPQERALIESTLVMRNQDILAKARSQGLDKAATTAELYQFAANVEQRGCREEARRLRDKAASVARENEPPMTPQLASSTGGYAMRQLGPAASSTWAAPPPAVPVEVAPTVAVAAPAGAVAAKPVLARMVTSMRAAVRPEPRPWNDAWGRYGFSIPRGFPVNVVAFGPAGWAEVQIQHPEQGLAPGFMELAHLAPEGAGAPAAAATGMAARPGMAAMAGMAGRPGMGAAGKRPGGPMGGMVSIPTRQTKAQKQRAKKARARATVMSS